MLVSAIFQNKAGVDLGMRSIPEDCLIVWYGGAHFARSRLLDPLRGIYLYEQSDIMHVYNVDVRPALHLVKEAS